MYKNQSRARKEAATTARVSTAPSRSRLGFWQLPAAYCLLPSTCCLLLAAFCLLLSGCGPRPDEAFSINTEGRDVALLTRTGRNEVERTMTERFGRPDALTDALPKGVRLDLARLTESAGPVAGDREGRQRGLYRQHCAACHGTAGDGAGAYARLLEPYPCDFRLGMFKYTSTRDGGRPTRADLERTLNEGIPATAMPSFERLPQHEIDSLVDYVIYLSIRGEAERSVAQLVFDEGEYLPLEDYLVEDEAIAPVVWQWNEAERLAIDADKARRAALPVDTPEALTASIERGRRLYASNDSQCTKCHGLEGYGDGEEKDLFDAANKPKHGVTDEQTQQLAERFTLPLQRLKARNFHEGIFRGGRRPIDLYWRIHVGIKGTPMPSSGPDSSTSGVFSPAEIWDVVHYILSLSGK